MAQTAILMTAVMTYVKSPSPVSVVLPTVLSSMISIIVAIVLREAHPDFVAVEPFLVLPMIQGHIAGRGVVLAPMVHQMISVEHQKNIVVIALHKREMGNSVMMVKMVIQTTGVMICVSSQKWDYAA